MRVRLLTLMAGPDGVHEAGTVIDVSIPDGKKLINAGYAVGLEAPEVAAVMAPERAVEPRPAPKAPSPGPSLNSREGEEALIDLVGAGPGQALIEAGIRSIMQARLAIQAGEDLTEIDGVGPATVKKLKIDGATKDFNAQGRR